MVKRAETMSIRSTLFEFDMRLYDRNDINRTDKVLYGSACNRLLAKIYSEDSVSSLP